ncbi:hypothetical protein [Succinivibrio sp.]|uniref:hypothetical protein n=1 Tax=Succinivibrio sp. TaxID=2053619 RepID=UPI0038702DBE
MNSGGFLKKDETKNEVTLHAKPPNTKKVTSEGNMTYLQKKKKPLKESERPTT